MDYIKEIQDKLFSARDTQYAYFSARLIPNIPPESFIGVRTPELRKYAKELSDAYNKNTEKKECVEVFLNALPHTYYEENNLHGFIVSGMKDYDDVITKINRFLPFIDNWATCDSTSPKIFKKHLSSLLNEIPIWISDSHTYTKRFGIEMLMSFYLDDNFKPEYLDLPASIRSDEYYVNMMTAWFFATALAKQYDATLPFITDRRLDKWTHNKTIRKAIESYRITDEQKTFLRSLAY